MEINTARALESFHQEEERILSEKLAVLQSLLEVSQDAATPLEELANTQTSLQTISEKLHTLQESLQNLEASREQDLQILREEMEGRISKDLEAAKKSWMKDCLLEMETKLGEHRNSHEDLCLCESHNCNLETPSIEQALWVSHKVLLKYSPFFGREISQLSHAF